jgi:predicted signal transduction protein with EAL and GGDEF domain
VVTISLGVAFAQEGAAPEIVAKRADDALYDAKRGGRNLVFLSNAHAAADACRLQPLSPIAFSSEVDAGSRKENA